MIDMYDDDNVINAPDTTQGVEIMDAAGQSFRPLVLRSKTPNGAKAVSPNPNSTPKPAPQVLPPDQSVSGDEAPDYDQLVDELAELDMENEKLRALLLKRTKEIKELKEGKPNEAPEDVRYINQILSSMGIPEVSEDGRVMSLADRVVHLANQLSLSSGALQLLRNEMIGFAHKTKASGHEAIARDILSLLDRSAQIGSFVVFSEINS